MSNLVAHGGAESRRQSRDLGSASDRRGTFDRLGLFGRGRANGIRRFGWRTEAPTEFELGRLLIDLDDSWTVFSAVDLLGDRDADFVVVGPAGVFLIAGLVRRGSKVWVDEQILWVNGRPTDHIARARAAAESASSRLSAALGRTVHAIPVIALPEPLSVSFGGDAANRVVTLPADLVTTWITECVRRLTAEEVVELAAIAEERATWGSQASDPRRLSRVR